MSELLLHKLAEHTVAAVVVLYNPEPDVYDNIMSYYDQVDRLVLVDNSESSSEHLFARFIDDAKVEIIANKGNLGIATALNQGIRIALDGGYSHALTMDQDSRATPGMVACLNNLFTVPELSRLAIAAPFHLTSIDRKPLRRVPSYSRQDTVWTSGNLLSLEAYRDAGPFADELFIDFVDHEYCLRLKRLDYVVAQSFEAILYHGFGNNLTALHIFSRPLVITNHAPIRRYYITRNRFWLARKYPEFKRFIWIDRRRFITELILILLFEKDKLHKIKMIVAGIRDYFSQTMGKYDAN